MIHRGESVAFKNQAVGRGQRVHRGLASVRPRGAPPRAGAGVGPRAAGGGGAAGVGPAADLALPALAQLGQLGLQGVDRAGAKLVLKVTHSIITRVP